MKKRPTSTSEVFREVCPQGQYTETGSEGAKAVLVMCKSLPGGTRFEGTKGSWGAAKA